MSHFKPRPYGYVKIQERGYKRAGKYYECAEVMVWAFLRDGTVKNTSFGIKKHGVETATELANRRLREWIG